MRVRADWHNVQKTTLKDYTIRFVFGGVVTAVAGLVAKHYGPAIGGLLLAFPAIFPASLTLVEKHEDQDKNESGTSAKSRSHDVCGIDSAGAALGSFGLAAFAVVIWLGAARMATLPLLLLAGLAWCCVSLAAWAIRQRL